MTLSSNRSLYKKHVSLHASLFSTLPLHITKTPCQCDIVKAAIDVKDNIENDFTLQIGTKLIFFLYVVIQLKLSVLYSDKNIF